MDLIKEELLYIKGPKSYKTADGTLQILGKDVQNNPSEILIVPKCEKIVHRLCDKYTRGITTMDADKYFCPQCADFDPETRKKRPKVPKGKSKK